MLRLCGIPCIVTDMPNTNAVIADRVRGVAAEKRLNQQAVATILGLSRTSIAERYSGRIPFTGPELYVLSSSLDVRIDRFFPSHSAASSVTASPRRSADGAAFAVPADSNP